MPILDELKKIRKEKGILQKDIAKKLGMTAERFNRYEKGNRKIDIDFVIDFARELGYELILIRKFQFRYEEMQNMWIRNKSNGWLFMF